MHAAGCQVGPACWKAGHPGDRRGGERAWCTERLNRLHGNPAQVLALNNERFMVPEVVFCPADIGLRQAGLAQVLPI